MTEIIPWIATIATILAAFLTAANLGPRITGYGFCVFLVGSVAWVATGFLTSEPALIWTDSVLTVLNVFGIWRWLGRQTEVLDGARAASKASERTPGEALFPVSMLSGAAVVSGARELGRCVDAMAGCSSGRLDYVVVSEGGLAGIGETLRRLPWDRAHVDGERLVAQLTPAEFSRLQQLPRDQWPGR